MANEPVAAALSNTVSVMKVQSGSLYISEVQQEFGEDVATSVVPAKSIWMNTKDAVKLRDFLNRHYPNEDMALPGVVKCAVCGKYCKEENARKFSGKWVCVIC